LTGSRSSFLLETYPGTVNNAIIYALNSDGRQFDTCPLAGVRDFARVSHGSQLGQPENERKIFIPR